MKINLLVLGITSLLFAMGVQAKTFNNPKLKIEATNLDSNDMDDIPGHGGNLSDPSGKILCDSDLDAVCESISSKYKYASDHSCKKQVIASGISRFRFKNKYDLEFKWNELKWELMKEEQGLHRYYNPSPYFVKHFFHLTRSEDGRVLKVFKEFSASYKDKEDRYVEILKSITCEE